MSKTEEAALRKADVVRLQLPAEWAREFADECVRDGLQPAHAEFRLRLGQMVERVARAARAGAVRDVNLRSRR